MTGIHVRVRRDGQWQSVEIDRLTDEELNEFEADLMEKGGAWQAGAHMKALARFIRDNVHSKRPIFIISDETNEHPQ